MIGAIVAGGLSAMTPPVTNSYESIQTYTVGSGGTPNITFSVIPSTYKHLQVRIMARTTSAAPYDGLLMRIGTGGTIDTTSTLYGHHLTGDGSGSATAGSRSSTNIEIAQATAATATAGMFGVTVIDVLEYANTSKNKTFRSLTGFDLNGSGQIKLMSGSYGANTNAITDLRFYSAFADIAEGSSFALYGIKG